MTSVWFVAYSERDQHCRTCRGVDLMDAANALEGDAEATPTLTDRDREILDFERQWWKYAGAKETAVREKFDMSSTRYYQVLNALIDRPEALEADPLLVRRLRRLRSARQRQRSDAARTKQNALLAGLLFCQSCNRPMIATYTATRGRRFRYYVCQRARQSGWDSCRTKAVPAVLIEDSVVAQLRTALSNEETRRQLQVQEDGWQLFQEGDPAGLVRSVVENILYDGSTGAVTLTLGNGGGEL